MKNFYIRILLLTLILLMIVFPGCFNNKLQDPSPNANNTVTTDVHLTIMIPNYDANSIRAKIVDPLTYTVEVSISAPDMTTIQQTFNFDTNGGDWVNGYGYMDCVINNVPVGTARLFNVVTKDQEGNLLTAGARTTNISIHFNGLYINLTPCYAPLINPGDSISGSVAAGRMVYYKVDLGTEKLCEITLLSASDVGLYVFTSGGYSDLTNSITWNWGFANKAMLNSEYDSSYYLCIYGKTGCDFTIDTRPIRGRAFDANLKMVNVTPEAFSTITSTGNRVWPSEPANSWCPAKEAPIGFDFIFNGVSYNKLFVSINAVVSFWPYALNYQYQNFFGQEFPCNLISLFMEQYYGNNNWQRVYYQTQGTAPDRKFIIEYSQLQKGSSSIYLTGQIILSETDNSIKLVYDRNNSSTSGLYGVIGLKNEDGSSLLGSDSCVQGIPQDDYLFRYE